MDLDNALEQLIREKCQYDPDDALRTNEEQYLQFKDEIECFNAGELTWEQLSPCAQDTIREWEWIIEGELEAQGYWENNSEY